MSYVSEKVLRNREERLRAIMDYAAEAIVVIDSDGVISDFNKAAQGLFGYTTGEAVGQNVNLLMPSPYRERHDDYLARYLKTGERRIMNQPRELSGLRKNGSIFPLELTVTEIDHLSVFVGIMRDLSDKKRLEKQVADISTQEQERIGQEIHDALCQQLTGLSLLATGLKKHLVSQNIPGLDQMDLIIEQLQQAIKEAYRLSRGLAPVPITPDGLIDALTVLANDVQTGMDIDCRFEAHTPVAIKDRTFAVQIYRIAAEAVHNAGKHAQASKIRIDLKTGPDACELTVSDNGRGFQAGNMMGMGIPIMRYRAGTIGCHLTIESSPGKGTVVRCKNAQI